MRPCCSRSSRSAAPDIGVPHGRPLCRWPSADAGNGVSACEATRGLDQDAGQLDYGANRKDVQMPKDTKKMAAARSRCRMGGKKRKAAAKVKAIRRAVHDVLSERQTKRRNQRQKGKAGR